MADLVQTATNVRVGEDAVIQIVQAGEAITAGMPVYKYSTDGKYYKGDANDSTKYDIVGIAVTSAGADEYFVLLKEGEMNLGATTVAGEIYILSATAGAIAPSSDLTTGMYPVTLCKATDTSGNVDVNIDVGDTAHG